MKKKRIRTYWLLLLVLLYTGSAVLSVGEAQARYVNTAGWDTILEGVQKGITSDCLVSREDTPMTVLLGEISIEIPTKADFWIKSTGMGEPEGKLVWKIAEEEYIQYLRVEMSAGADTLENGTEIQLMDGYAMHFEMTLTPTDNARLVAHKDLLIHIVVGWGSEMRGVFQVQLPASVPEGTILPEDEQTEPTEETQPPDPTVETEPAEETEEPPPVTEETEQTTPPTEPPAEETTAPTEETEALPPTELNTQEGTEATEGETESTVVTTVPTEETTESTEETTASTEPEETEPSEATEPEETIPPETEEEPVPYDPIVKLETVKSFDPASLLPVKLTASGGITSVYLGMGTIGEDGTASEIQPFPDKTRFSVDGGKSYYLMYRGHAIQVNMEVATTTVLLDFSMAELTKEAFHLFAEGYNRFGDFISSCSAGTAPDVSIAYPVEIHPLTPQTHTEQTQEETKDIAQPNILTQDTYLEITFPEGWTEYRLDYSIERLTLTEDAKLTYIEVETDGADNLLSGSLIADYVNELDAKGEPMHKLVLLTGPNLPQAGTYRVNMNWSYEGICFAETQTAFFINYSAYSLNAE